MRRANAIAGLVLCAVAVVMLAVVIPAEIETGPAGMMSPRIVPNLMMGAILVLSAILVFANSRSAAGEPGEPEEPPITFGEIKALAGLSAVFAVAVALFSAVSPLAGGVALVAGGLLVLGERRPLAIIGLPAVLLIALWALFYKVLGTAIL